MISQKLSLPEVYQKLFGTYFGLRIVTICGIAVGQSSKITGFSPVLLKVDIFREHIMYLNNVSPSCTLLQIDYAQFGN